MAPFHTGTEDEEEPFEMIQKMAEQRVPEAPRKFADRRSRGNVLDKGESEAAKWYLLAAKQGDAMSQMIAGVMYRHGKGIRKDPQEAAKWLHLAANQSLLGAYDSLGAMYLAGEGVPQNKIVAYAIFNALALRAESTRGAIEMRQYYDALTSSLQVGERAQATRLSMELEKPGNFSNAIKMQLFNTDFCLKAGATCRAYARANGDAIAMLI